MIYFYPLNPPPPPRVGSNVTLCENGSVFIRCHTMPIGAALAIEKVRAINSKSIKIFKENLSNLKQKYLKLFVA